MRLLQFNIQFGCPFPDRSEGNVSALENTVEVIRKWNPDILFLQEVEQALPGGEQLKPAPNYGYLKKALQEYHSFFSYPPEDPEELPFGIGQAIFSKFPILHTFARILPAPEFEFEFEGKVKMPTRRVLVGADIDHVGKRIRLLNTHLQSFFIVNRDVREFPEQREQVGDEVRKSPYPVILGGDFNSAPGEDTVDYFEQYSIQTVQKQCITWHRMPYVLDHLFYTAHFVCKEWKVISSTVSDHMPLFAEIDWL